MNDLLIADKFDVDPAQLSAALAGALYPTFAGLSTGPYGVRIHFTGKPSAQATATATELVDAHVPDVAAREAEVLALKTGRAAVVVEADKAVGAALADSTDEQLRALVSLLLAERGGLDSDGKVRPLAEWVDGALIQAANG